MNLNDFITAVTIDSNVHVCIHDVSGATYAPKLWVWGNRRLHSTEFCRCAKNLPGGLMTCIDHKDLTGVKAKETGKPFLSRCPFGTTSVVHPVYVHNEMVCIIYITMLTDDIEETKKTLTMRAELLKGNPKNLLKQTAVLQQTQNTKQYMALAEAIDTFIQHEIKELAPNTDEKKYHPAVLRTLSKIRSEYDKNIDLEEWAKKQGINAKYLGRLFQSQTGRTFHSYLNEVRLSRAKILLSSTSISIIEIALSCGYNTVTYFNRIFKQNVGISPSEYRKKYK